MPWPALPCSDLLATAPSYFPEPDLPPLLITDEAVEDAKVGGAREGGGGAEGEGARGCAMKGRGGWRSKGRGSLSWE